MNWKKYSPITAIQAMGIIVLIIVGGVGAMTVMALQVELPSGTGTFIAYEADMKYHRSLYQVSDYTTGYNHDGDPYIYNLQCYEGRDIDMTLTPKVLAVDSVYLIRVSTLYWGIDDQGPVNYLSTFGSWIKNPDKDVIKIVEYDISGNIVPLGSINVPKSNDPDSSWWLVMFCADMGYRGGPDNNPDGKIIIDIVVI